ncbi:MAG TPA: hypothetical protein VH333_24745 [Pseudonocardiaceae bacterium]|nr:hypothetical protein [Pseudonocardiaceae bacterium]
MTGVRTEIDPSTLASLPRAHRFRAPSLMLVVVVVGAALPLVRNHIFYFWDDTAGVGVPMWHRIAGSVLHGQLPLLNLDMWRGGNFAAEAATGMWNPVMVAIAVAVYPIDNLAVGITIGKVLFMLVMAGGMYLLARDYGVRRGLSGVVGAVLPLAGYSFFMDSTAWVNALMLTAFTPWVWWTARLAVHRGRSPLWFVLAGYLAVSIGNPYGLLSTGLVIVAVAAEAWFAGTRRRIVTLCAAGIAVLLLNVMTYLPLLLTSSLGYRAGSQTANDGTLKPSMTNLLELSTPSTQPEMPAFHLDYFTVPVVYLAWFVLPTVPWLRWWVFGRAWRAHLGAFVFGAGVLLLMLGPSQLWMFRWPLRLIDFCWIAVLLLWAGAANQGMARTHLRARTAVSVAIVAVGAYLAWGERPNIADLHVYGAVAVLVLVALLIRFGMSSRAGFGVLTVGTLVVLGLQVLWFPSNDNVMNYQFPTSTEQLQQRFAKYQGTVVQVAAFDNDPAADRLPARDYQDLLYGSMYSVAGVAGTTAYSGIGFSSFDGAFCMAYEGDTCAQLWPTLWQHPAGYPVPLADLLRARTVVVQNSLVDTRSGPAPSGWRRSRADETSGLATVWTRDTAPPWPDGLLSYVSADIDVTADQRTGAVDERVTYRAPAAGMLTFARLAWPGYTATVDGQPVPTTTGPAGLLVVHVPAGDGTVALAWHPPGERVSIVAFAVGVLLTLGLAVARRRRRSPMPQGETHP